VREIYIIRFVLSVFPHSCSETDSSGWR